MNSLLHFLLIILTYTHLFISAQQDGVAQLGNDGIITVSLPFMDLSRSTIPSSIPSTSLESRIKFARLIRTYAYYTTSSHTPVLVMGDVDGKCEEWKGVVKNGYFLLCITLTSSTSYYDYAYDMMIGIREMIVENSTLSSPIAGKMGSSLLFFSSGIGAEMSFLTNIINTTWPSTVTNVGYVVMDATMKIEGGVAGVERISPSASLLFLSTSPSCTSTSASPPSLVLYGAAPRTTCRTHIIYHGTCPDCECTSSTLSYSSISSLLIPYLSSQLYHNTTSWLTFRTQLHHSRWIDSAINSNTITYQTYQDCIRDGIHYTEVV